MVVVPGGSGRPLLCERLGVKVDEEFYSTIESAYAKFKVNNQGELYGVKSGGSPSNWIRVGKVVEDFLCEYVRFIRKYPSKCFTDEEVNLVKSIRVLFPQALYLQRVGYKYLRLKIAGGYPAEIELPYGLFPRINSGMVFIEDILSNYKEGV